LISKLGAKDPKRREDHLHANQPRMEKPDRASSSANSKLELDGPGRSTAWPMNRGLDGPIRLRRIFG
jgi:hypothetical protein